MAVMLLGLAGTVALAQFLDKSYPIRSWLALPLLAIYGWEIFLTLACAGLGRLVLLRALRLSDLQGLQLWALALPVGLVGFVLAMFAAGYIGLFGPWLAVILPASMSACWLFTDRERLRRLHWSLTLRPASLVATVFGVLCLGVMYLELLSPDALNYDSTWFHLTVSQDYAREGRIVPFIANWTKNVPHFASIVQTWSFIVPGPWPIDHPVRWMLTLHTEFTIFLWTLVGIAAAVSWLCERQVPAGWVAFFLFPGIFVYDLNLGGASDHFVALFAAPLVLATARVVRRFEAGSSALLGILAAGATMTKLQAIYTLVPIAALLAARWLQLAFARLRARPEALEWSTLLRGPLVALACFVVVACPQYLENFVWFHNPFYPFMQRVFTRSTPAFPDAAQLVDTLYADWRWQAPRELSKRVSEAAELTLSYSLEPHYSFFGNRPYFGSLFTFLSPLLLFLPHARRLWMAFLVGLAALFLWGFTYRVDRNLQTFLPILAAVSGAIIARGWQLGLAARTGIVALVGLHTIWSADLMFTGNDRLQAGVALIKSGLDGNASQRFDGYRRGYRDVGNVLPADGLVVLHNSHLSLGINRRILLDWIGFQGLIDYRSMKSPRDAYDRFAALGITHFLVIPNARSSETMQGEVIFDLFTGLYAQHKTDAGGFAVYTMPSSPPPAQEPTRVLAMGLPGYADGVYRIESLGTIETMPPAFMKYAPPEIPATKADAERVLPRVDAALVAPSKPLDGKALDILRNEFRVVATYGAFTVYARVPSVSTLGAVNQAQASPH
jgi:hypothetical protein